MGGVQTQPAQATNAAVLLGQKIGLQRRVNSAANWFMWIAALSLINSLSGLAGSSFRFIVGLGLTQVIDQLAGGPAKFSATVLDVLAAGIFVGFGAFARKRHDWAFIAGMILYALDALIFVLGKDVISIAFHLLALYYLYRGLKANEALARLTGVAPA